MARKQCGRCARRKCVPTYRFCGTCLDIVRKEMADSGYLSPLPEPLPHRSSAAREDRSETKWGVDDNYRRDDFGEFIDDLPATNEPPEVF